MVTDFLGLCYVRARMASKLKAEKVETTATVGNFGELTCQLNLVFSVTS